MWPYFHEHKVVITAYFSSSNYFYDTIRVHRCVMNPYRICIRRSSLVKAEEDLWIETSYPFNEVTAVFLLNNPRYQLLLHCSRFSSSHSSPESI